MPHFIDIGFCERINLDYVERIVERCDEHGRPITTFYDRKGEVVGTSRYDVDWDERVARVIPAASGASAVLVYVNDKGDRPTKHDVRSRHESIIAWKLTPYCLTPVFSEDPGSNVTVLIELPDGSLRNQGDCTYGDLSAALADILSNTQEHWDDEHNARVVTPMKEAAE